MSHRIDPARFDGHEGADPGDAAFLELIPGTGAPVQTGQFERLLAVRCVRLGAVLRWHTPLSCQPLSPSALSSHRMGRGPGRGIGIALLALVAALVSAPAQPAGTETETEHGLALTLSLVGPEPSRAAAPASIVALYVPAGQPAHPFLPSGPFTATFDGFLSVPLRDNYFFRAELNGAVRVTINGQTVLEASGEGRATEPTPRVRLNRGLNPLEVHYTSPAQGDAFLRLIWSSRDVPWEPIPPSALSRRAHHEELDQARLQTLGRALFVESQCVQCHQMPAPPDGLPDLFRQGPSLESIGGRRNFDWLARWVADPQALRPSARMPRLLDGADASEHAADIAAYLVSLRHSASLPVEESSEPAAGRVAAGEHLFQALHCAACHHLPGQPGANSALISLEQVRNKFPRGALAVFLQEPEAHHPWTGMPNFNLSRGEAEALAAWLDSLAPPPAEADPPSDPATIERGRLLVQTSGCLNCHSLNLENRFSAPAPADLLGSHWHRGCLAEEPPAYSSAPRFSFAAEERAALRAFAGADRLSLTRHVPSEFAARTVQRLNCLNCHGQFDGFPPLDHLGGKLKPGWTRRLLSGELEYKPRPWIEARMPAFPQYAEALASGLALQHGHSPVAPPEPPVDWTAAELGRRMTGVTEGFSCVACHQVGAFNAGQVVEAAGINLAYSGERLLYPYFERWMTDPLRIDPLTKMPVYFEDGRSLLVEYFDGDAEAQIRALWEYIRLGANMPFPHPDSR